MKLAKEKKTTIDFVFLLAVFGTFIVSSMLVLILGANVYTETANSTSDNYKARTAYYYITEKIKAHDKLGTIEVRNTANSKSVGLIFYENVEGIEYRTYLYYFDGYINEATLSSEEEFNYDKGTKLLKLNDFKADIEGDRLLHLYIKDDKDYVSDFYISTAVPLRDITEKKQIGSDGPEKKDVNKKAVEIDNDLDNALDNALDNKIEDEEENE